MSEPLQHSPGPFIYDDIRRSIINAIGLPICEMTQYEWEGDRALFIAAPDMLRLLRVFAAGELRRASIAELRAAHAETAALIARLDGGE